MNPIAKANCWLALVMVVGCWYLDPGISAIAATAMSLIFVGQQFHIRNLQRRLERYERPRVRTTIERGYHP